MASKLFLSGLFFLFILLSGFWLSRTGKPYNMLINAAHKLIGLGAGVYLGMTVYQMHQAAPLSSLEIAVAMVTILLFIGLVVTGGLLSAEKIMPAIVLLLHKLLPYLTILSTAAMILLLAQNK